ELALTSLVSQTRALSPLATLRRGYTVLQAADGAVVCSVTAISNGDEVVARLADGRLGLQVTSTEHSEPSTPATDHGKDGP
ncbi:MAG: exodeoxyribonuclease VII large subunit, partial [Sciscionella sp.]